MIQALQYIGAFLALLISGGFVNLLVQHWYLEPRRRREEEASRKKERATRLHLFALEAVELQERWVQYAGQALKSEISLSSPFELTNADHVNELIRLGVEGSVSSGIYFIKELTNDVRRLVLRSNDELVALAQLPPGQRAELQPWQATMPQRTFNSATAFIMGRWPRVTTAIESILRAYEVDAGSPLELRERFKKNSADYEAIRPNLEKKDQQEHPKKP